MYTKKEISRLNAALNRVRKCSGDCKHCEKCHFYSAESGRFIYYAFGCDLLPTDMFSHIAESTSELKNKALEVLEFELS